MTEYLDPQFDPKKLTIPQLTSILSKHDIPLPGNLQRKAFYLELFNSEIKPRAAQLSKQLLNVKPSHAGIEFVGNHKENIENIPENTTEKPSKRLQASSTDEIEPKAPKRRCTLGKDELKLLEKNETASPLAETRTQRRTSMRLNQPLQESQVPTLDRFLISPQLPGIRDKVKSTPKKDTEQLLPKVSELREFWNNKCLLENSKSEVMQPNAHISVEEQQENVSDSLEKVAPVEDAPTMAETKPTEARPVLLTRVFLMFIMIVFTIVVVAAVFYASSNFDLEILNKWDSVQVSASMGMMMNSLKQFYESLVNEQTWKGLFKLFAEVMKPVMEFFIEMMNMCMDMTVESIVKRVYDVCQMLGHLVPLENAILNLQ